MTILFERNSCQSVFRGILFLMLIFISGCVNQSKYLALQHQYADLKQKNSSMLDENNKLKNEMDWLESKSISLSKKINELQGDLNTLSITNQELIAQKEKHQQELQRLREEFNSAISSKEAKIILLENSLKVEMVEKVLFEQGSATVTKEGKKILSRIAPILKNGQNQRIRVIGHADELPPSKNIANKYPSNWELSTARATAVIRILQWGYGIDPKRLVAEGMAHYRMKEPGLDEKKGPKQKRAVEIVLSLNR